MSDREHTSNGIGVLGLLQVAFIVLKVAKVIDWRWWVVFIPTFISFGIGLLLILIGICMVIYEHRRFK